MRVVSNKLILVLWLIIGLVGCGSTPKEEKYIEPLSQIKLSSEKTYAEVLSSISTQMDIPIQDYAGEFGEIKYVEYNAKHFSINDIDQNFNADLSKSCVGYLSGMVNSLETVYASNRVDFSQYIGQEKIDLIRRVNSESSPGSIMGFDFDGSRVHWTALYRPSRKASSDEFAYISSIEQYSNFAFKGHPYFKKVSNKESYVCLGNSIVSEILIVGNIPDKGKNIVLLIPKEAAFKMIQKQLSLALEAVVHKLNASSFEEAVAAIERKREEAENEKRRKAQEAELQAKRAKLQREADLKLMIEPESIGRKICRNGELAFQAHARLTDIRLYGEPIQRYRADGQISGFIEGASPDKSRLQIRVSGFALEDSGIKPVSTPILGHISALAGSLTWDAKENWFFCD